MTAVNMEKGNSDLVFVDENVLASRAANDMPNIASVHVSKSSRVHIGPKIVAVNQTIENKEMIKGHILGLELVSTKSTRRLRCSVAVFLCWALLVASGLTVYFVYFALLKHQVRLDIELPLPKYIWTVIRNTTKAERLSCLAAMAALFVCVFLIVYYSLGTTKPVVEDVAPHEWKISRQMWLAQDYNLFTTTKEFNPLKLIVIQNTVGRECHTFIECAAEVRNIQGSFLKDHGYDIPYSFLVGNDGRVYEGRGWNRVGAHTLGYNSCSMGIGFMGDYREEMPVYSKVTDLQIKNVMRLIEEGIREGHLVADYYVFGGKDVTNTCSPGSNLYKSIQKWDHYDHAKQFRNKNCSVIYGHI